MNPDFINSFWFTYLLLPFLIFLSRILDVSMDTLRIVFISKGDKLVAPVLGFFQVLIWIIAITRIMQNLENFTCYVAYAAGFAVGNYVGLRIEERLAIGNQLIRIITHKEANTLIHSLQEKGYHTTVIDAMGNKGLVHVIYLLDKRNTMPKIIDIINQHNPKAFYTIEDIRYVNIQNDGYNLLPKRDYLKRLKGGRLGR